MESTTITITSSTPTPTPTPMPTLAAVVSVFEPHLLGAVVILVVVGVPCAGVDIHKLIPVVVVMGEVELLVVALCGHVVVAEVLDCVDDSPVPPVDKGSVVETDEPLDAEEDAHALLEPRIVNCPDCARLAELRVKRIR
jgi:hypothetical protein